MEHFGHEHPLILSPEFFFLKDCKLCTRMISGPAYVCASSCDDEFYVHKSCGEYEQEIQHHPLHPDHSLKLSDPRSSSKFKETTCDGCRRMSGGFFYQCRDCDFNLHPYCIYMSPSVQYEGHQHPLTLVEGDRSNLLECEACGYLIRSCTFYLQCMQCRDIYFQVRCDDEVYPHQLPPAVVYAQHVHHHQPHPLTLITRPSHNVRSIPDLLYCDACKKERNQYHPFYICDECDYSAHVRCVITEKHVDRDKLKHIGHKHYLNFHDEIAENTGKHIASCDLCKKRVYHGTPAYSCATCKFSLHKSCAELPTEIQHPLHPSNSLTLSKTIYFRPCHGCPFGINRYYYGCKNCYFDLDVNCVYMSPSVRYEGHDHPLTLVEEIKSGTECEECGYDIEGTFYLRCVECRICFHVHECGPNPQHQLPPTIVDDDKHVQDHPLALISPEGVEEVGFCDACKKGRNPRHPFYKCAAESCDYSAHVRCMITEKPFDREKLKHPGHKHYLEFHENFHDGDGDGGGDGDSIFCDFCDKSVSQGTPAYSCATCKFALHKSCGEIPLKIQYPFHSHPLHLFPLCDLTRGCGACLAKCNRHHGDLYVYCCSECDDPSFALHIECSSLLPTIRFSGHRHPLIYLDKLPGNTKCIKRRERISNKPYTPCLRCVTCNFTIHLYCIPFPKLIVGFW